MSELLEFLNTASDADLIKAGELSQALSKRVIEARPFSSLEDVLKVKGMTSEKLAALESATADKPVEEPASTEEIKPENEEPVKTAPVVKMTRGWVRVLRWVLILLVLAGAVYAILLYGVPFIYNTFLRPVENNTAQLSQVATQQASDTKRLEGEIATLQERVTELESRADAVDKSLAAHDKTLANLATIQTELKQSISDQNTQLIAQMSYQVDLLRAVNYLSRCRLYLSQSNFGLAREDALSARQLLSSLQASAPAGQAYAMNEAANRLDLALANLPAYPVVAVYDIDIAWQYLADGLSATAPTITAPTTAPTEITLTPEVTPTP